MVAIATRPRLPAKSGTTAPSESMDWLKPSPTWDFAARDYRQTEFFQPSILEFTTDDFVTEFLSAAVSPDPSQLTNAIAQPVEDQTLKLFQPIHGRYYVVCATLACRMAGFPDRQVNSRAGDSVFFVLRRVISGHEYAWVGAEGKRVWQSTDSTARQVLDGEERIPLSPAPTADGRSLHFGYISVSSRETYKVPAAQLADDGDPAPDLRVEEFGSRVSEPMTGPIDPGTKLPDFSKSAIDQTKDEQARLSSVYLLLEGFEYFQNYLPDLAKILRGDSGAALEQPQAAEKQALLDHLKTIVVSSGLTLAAALGKGGQQREVLNQEGGVESSGLDALGFSDSYNLKVHPVSGPAMLQTIDKLRAALPGEAPAIDLPKLTPRDDAEYVVRMVYERTECDPVQRYISLPSRNFRLAPYFDPDAPARAIKIALPADVSVAGLRKFKPGVTFMLSESMQKKMQSLSGKERDLLKDANTSLDEGGGIAWICSFSIQIIFIIAFMLMIMFAFIFNIIFWWMFFFKICLPIPKSLLPK